MDRLLKKFYSIILVLALAINFASCSVMIFEEEPTSEETTITSLIETTVEEIISEETTSESTTEETKENYDDEYPEDTLSVHYAGVYDSKDDVALYIHLYGELPSNYITKKEAKALGWEGGSLEPYASGKTIGGDYFGNYEGVLPKGKYHECDIDTMGKSSRGAKRIIYDTDGDIYYTEDHYETFTKLY